MGYDVFLSYRRSDQAIARALVTELEALGVSVWWDQMIAGGEDWRDAIVAGLEGAASLVILFSEECNASKQLKKELAIADTLDKLVVPVLIEDTQPKGHYLYELAARNWIQIFPDAETKAAKLAAKLAATLESADLRSRTPRVNTVAREAPAMARPVAEASTAVAPNPTTPPKSAKSKSKKDRRDFLPFKWLDILLIAAGFGLFYVMFGEDAFDFDYPLEAAGQMLGLLALLMAAYGALIFPIRYFMRGRRVRRAALMYALSTIVLMGFFLGGLLIYYEGDVSELSSDDLVITFGLWGVMGVFAIALYAIMSGLRAVRSFRKNVEVI